MTPVRRLCRKCPCFREALVNIEFRKSTLLLLLVALASPAPTARAQSSGIFTTTGSMITPRAEHTATLLLDGRVLIAGGTASNFLGNDSYPASAELYDPSTGRFTATGNMIARRRMHTATLLGDGRVLIAGGAVGNSPLSSAELYDPSTETFTATGSMITAKAWHTAVLLPTGKVLIAGGFGGATYPNVVPAELYDPATGTFSPAGAYASNGVGSCDLCPPTTLLNDGTVLFTGQDQAQIYDSTGTFRLTGAPSPCLSAGALVMGGKVLFAGGECVARNAEAEIYDPTTGAFTPTGKMASPRVWHTLTGLPSGMVLAAGGETDNCSASFCMFAGSAASAELYDPSTGVFTLTGSMTVPRETHTATLLRDGRVLIAGGLSYGGIGIFNGTTASAELYTPACPANYGDACSADPWQPAITAMETAAGTNSLNFWQWAWYWQYLPRFQGAPAGFGVVGSISPGAMEQIIVAGGGDGFRTLSAEQWAQYLQLTVLPQGPWQYAITAMKNSAGSDSLSFWQWAWYWQRGPAFNGAPAGFGVADSFSPDLMVQIIAAGGGDGSQLISAEQWMLYYRRVAAQ